MNGRRTLLVAFVVVALVVSTIQLVGLYRTRARLQASLREMDRVEAYHRGFANGINAIIKWLKFDTNTCKFTLELTNVLSEMKP